MNEEKEITKNPLAAKKKRELDEKVNISKENDNEDIIEKKPRKPRKKKEEVEEKIIDDSELQNQAGFAISLISMGRAALGVDVPLNEELKAGFTQGYIAISKKYGDIMGKYMPEFMLLSAIGMIGYDTYIHMVLNKKKQIEESQKQNKNAE